MKEFLIIFFSAFGAATILPIYSEATLIYYLHTNYPKELILLSATIGNSLGSILNYYMGKKGIEYLIKKRLVNEKRLDYAFKLFNRYGGIVLMLSWAPFIGDPITFVAGVLHYNIKKFIIIVTFAKFIRYFLLMLGFYLL